MGVTHSVDLTSIGCSIPTNSIGLPNIGMVKRHWELNRPHLSLPFGAIASVPSLSLSTHYRPEFNKKQQTQPLMVSSDLKQKRQMGFPTQTQIAKQIDRDMQSLKQKSPPKIKTKCGDDARARLRFYANGKGRSMRDLCLSSLNIKPFKASPIEKFGVSVEGNQLKLDMDRIESLISTLSTPVAKYLRKKLGEFNTLKEKIGQIGGTMRAGIMSIPLDLFMEGTSYATHHTMMSGGDSFWSFFEGFRIFASPGEFLAVLKAGGMAAVAGMVSGFLTRTINHILQGEKYRESRERVHKILGGAAIMIAVYTAFSSNVHPFFLIKSYMIN